MCVFAAGFGGRRERTGSSVRRSEGVRREKAMLNNNNATGKSSSTTRADHTESHSSLVPESNSSCTIRSP